MNKKNELSKIKGAKLNRNYMKRHKIVMPFNVGVFPLRKINFEPGQTCFDKTMRRKVEVLEILNPQIVNNVLYEVAWLKDQYGYMYCAFGGDLI